MRKISKCKILILVMALVMLLAAVTISASASTENVESTPANEYGVVPDEYTNGIEYPFVVFSNGDFKGAYKYWADSDSTVNSALERAIELANGASGVGVKVTILLQSDYSNSRGSTDNNTVKFGQFTGELTIDLNNHTLTSGKWMLFSFNGQLVDGKLYDQKVTVKNGTLHAGEKVIYAIEQYNTAWSEESHGRKLIDVTFQNVTFGQSPDYKTEKGPFLENTSNSSPIDFKALYENCVFDYDNHASGTGFTMLNFSGTSGVKADITIKGGYVELSTFQNFNLYKISTTDSVKFAKNDEGEYMIAKVAESGATTTANFTGDNGEILNFAHFETKDSRKNYKLISLVTDYGTIPLTNASLVDYPFAVFVNGEFKGAYKYWADKDSTVNSAIERAHELANGDSGVGVKVNVLLRTDFANTRSSDNDSATHKLGQFTGELTVDLNGYTLTAGTWMLFSFNGQLVGGKLYDQKVTVKNGTLLAGNKVIYAVEQYNTAWTEESHGRKLIDVTFQNVAFGQSASYSIEKVPFLDNTSTTKLSPIDFKVLYEDCVFNYDNHKSGTGFTMFDFSVASGVQADITIKGGTLNTTTLQNFNIYKLSTGDSFKFVKGTDGKYVQLLLNKDVAAPTSTYSIENGNAKFVKIFETGTQLVYSLVPVEVSNINFTPKTSITLGSELVYNVYVPVMDSLKSFTVDGKTHDNLIPVTLDDGNQYYHIAVPMAASEAARNVVLKATVTVDGKDFNGTWTMSILKYSAKVLVSDANATEKTLVKDVLSYIKAAYIYFDAEDKTAVVDTIDEILGDYNNTFAKVEGNTDADDGLWGVVIALEEKPVVRFVLPEGVTADSYTFKAGNTVLDFTIGTMTVENKTYNYAEVSLYAYQMIREITYTNGTESGCYHINSYYDYVTTDDELKNDTNLISLVEKLYNYCKSAEVYRASVTNK